MLKFKFYTFLILLIFITALSAHENSLRKFTDMNGREIAVPQDISRIACIGRGSLRLACYLHAADLAVGVEFPERKQTEHVRPYLTAFPYLKDLPSIGHGAKGDPELLIQVQPQVIFYADGDVGALNIMQAKTNVPVVGIHCGNLTDEFSDFQTCLQLIAAILHQESRCDSLLSFVQAQLLDIRQLSAKVEQLHQSAYIGGLIYKGMHGITSTQANYTPFQLLGLTNVAAALSTNADIPVEISMEQLLLWNPDYIFLDAASQERTAAEFSKFPVLNALKAVKNERLYILQPSRLYGENFATTLINTFKIAAILLQDDVDLQQRTNLIYSTFLTSRVIQ